MTRPRSTLTTERSVRGAVPAPGQPFLVACAEGMSAMHVLPDDGQVIVGRSSTSDVVIDHVSISRRHVRLTMGATITVEDLGSANGTRVRGAPIEAGTPVEVAAGEAWEIGGVMAIVQRPMTAPPRKRRVWGHETFEALLEEECARAASTGAPLALIHIAGPGLTAAALDVDTLRPVDAIGEYGPGEYEVLLPGKGPEEAERARAALVAALAAEGVTVRAGVATWPRDGRDPDALLARAAARTRPDEPTPLTGVVVLDPAMQSLHRMLAQVAAGPISVLLLGETGVGKEILAETLHRRSPRASKPLLKLSCAALPETLLESELFGHEKGAFTGATESRAGLLESADGGTVFLDEIGELPMPTQAKLLRVLEDRQVMRVGGRRSREIDVRFVAATNRDLEAEIARGTFRQDLYYRLAGVALVVPPLRERPAEIEALAKTFVDRMCGQMARTTRPRLGPDALARLRAYSFPGNIRELRNAMERAVLLCSGATIEPEHLPLEKMKATPPAAASAPGLKPALAVVEKEKILAALEECAGNQTRAARLLGISRTTLLERLDAYGIPRPRKPQ